MTDFKTYLEQEKKLKYLTVKNYLSQIRNYHKLNANKITVEKVTAYLLDMQNPLRIMAMKTYLNFIGTEEAKKILIAIEKIRPKSTERKQMKTLEFKQGEELVLYLLKNEQDVVASICMCVYDTSVRIRAILKLRKTNIEPFITEQEKEAAYFNFEEKQGKFARRFVTPETFSRIKKAVNFDDLLPNAFIFFGRENVTDTEIDRKYGQLKDILVHHARELFGKQDNVTFHWLRRGAGIDIYRKTNNDVIATSKFLGDSVSQTEKYLKLQAEQAERVMEKTKRKW